MAVTPGQIAVTPGSGKILDTAELTVNSATVEREIVSIASPSTPGNYAEVTSGSALQVDGSAVTQPVSISEVNGSAIATAASGVQKVGISDSAGGTLNSVAKGTQAGNALGVQDFKDSGRTQITLYADSLTGITTEALATLNITKGLAAQTAATSYTVTAGKTLRIQSVSAEVSVPSTTACTARIRVRAAASGISVSSPIIISLKAASPAAVALVGGVDDVSIPDGLEIAGGTEIAISHVESSAITGSTTTGAGVSFCLIGFEY